MDPGGLCARILAYRPSWNLLEKRVADVRRRALADGRLHRPAFETGLRMQPSMEEVRLREHAYDFDPRWRSVRPAQARKLRSAFEITSGTSSVYLSVCLSVSLATDVCFLTIWGMAAAVNR